MSTQTNTQRGPITFVTATDLTGLEGRLVQLAAGGLTVSAAIADRVPLLVTEVESATRAVAEPFTAEKNHRVRAKGTGSRGAILVLADPTTPADAGKLRAIPTANGTYHTLAIAEEAFADGQLVLCRPIARETIVINN